MTHSTLENKNLGSVCEEGIGESQAGEQTRESKRQDVQKVAYIKRIWQRKVTNSLEDACVHDKCSPDITRKLTNALVTSFINMENGLPFEKAIDSAVSFISTRSQSNFNKSYLHQMFKFPDWVKGIKPEDVSFPIELVYVKNRPNMNNTAKLVVKYSDWDEVDVVIPTEKVEKFLRENSSDEIAELIGRYNFLCPTSGYFWSIHPEVYKMFEVEDCPDTANPLIEVIEGFSSPYNNNLAKYCSLYSEDEAFGSVGNFFGQIRDRGEQGESGYRRWIINPPYTNYVIDRMYEAISVRMGRFPNDEFYFMLPWWPQLRLITNIKTRGIGHHFACKSYRIFDHLEGTEISPRVDMFVGFIKSYPVTSSPILEKLIRIMDQPARIKTTTNIPFTIEYNESSRTRVIRRMQEYNSSRIPLKV